MFVLSNFVSQGEQCCIRIADCGLRIGDCPALKFQEELLKFEENRFREFGFYAMYQLRWI